MKTETIKTSDLEVNLDIKSVDWQEVAQDMHVFVEYIRAILRSEQNVLMLALLDNIKCV
ncbi:hypothetical protein KKD03_03130 [Patescibacteria group bacterium]|nr:hypothetical protein [Patescibacteria group bacterium]